MGEESESEKEETKEEEEQKVQLHFLMSDLDSESYRISTLKTLNFKSIHHPEIVSPPPEQC